MKKIVFVILFLLTFTHLYAQWIKLQNISYNLIGNLKNDGQNIFVCADRPYKSTNSGENWISFFTPQAIGDCHLSIIGNSVWVNDHYQNYYTSNDGINWVNANLNKYVYSFISHNSKIFAGTESWMYYITSNYGVNWYQGGSIGEDVNCFLNLGNKLFAGTSQGLFYTTNDGQNWSLTNCPVVGILQIVYNGSKLFAGTLIGIWTSLDSGMNWTQTNFGNNTVLSLEYSGLNIFAGTMQNGIFVSKNNGDNWFQKNEGIGDLRINSLTLINNILFAGTENSGLWKRPLSELVGIQNISTEIPSSYSLEQNYPNPFNPNTKIRFEIPDRSPTGTFGDDNVVLKVFDIMGKEIATLVNEQLVPGTYETTFDASMLTSGVYFYRLNAGDFSETKKMLLLK